MEAPQGMRYCMQRGERAENLGSLESFMEAFFLPCGYSSFLEFSLFTLQNRNQDKHDEGERT